MTPLDAALRYAAQGWRVFPCHALDGHDRCTCGGEHRDSRRNAGKHPWTRDGFKAASADEAQVRAWWLAHPEANVGIATGAMSGVVVLDVDVADGKPGRESLRLLEEQLGPLPATWAVQTGSGGTHYYLRATGPLGSRNGLRPGIDVKADGGYVIAPPSNHYSGGRYRWQTPAGAALADDAWLRRIVRPNGATHAAPAVAPEAMDVPMHERIHRASRYLARIDGAVSGSGGHDRAMRTAVAMVRGFGLDAEVAYSLLAAEWNPRCEPPWSEKELRHKVADAADKGQMAWGELLRRPAPSRGARALLDDDDVRGVLATPEGARWIGAKAGQAGVAIAQAAGGDTARHIAEGAQMTADGAVVPRPDDVEESQGKRVVRRLQAAGRPAGAVAACPTIVEIVRRAEVGGVEFDLLLSVADGTELRLRHLPAKALGSYAALSTLAIEHLVVLPRDKRSQSAWLEALAPALSQAREAAPDEEETVSGAVRAEIRRRLATVEIAEDFGDILRGLVWYSEAEGTCAVYPRQFVAHVRASLSEDKPSRQLILDIARAMGMTEVRPRLPDGRRARLWSFPQRRDSAPLVARPREPGDDDDRGGAADAWWD